MKKTILFCLLCFCLVLSVYPHEKNGDQLKKELTKTLNQYRSYICLDGITHDIKKVLFDPMDPDVLVISVKHKSVVNNRYLLQFPMKNVVFKKSRKSIRKNRSIMEFGSKKAGKKSIRFYAVNRGKETLEKKDLFHIMIYLPLQSRSFKKLVKTLKQLNDYYDKRINIMDDLTGPDG